MTRHCYNDRMQPDKFKAILHQECGLNPSLPIIAGFSGGADSLALIISLKAVGIQVISAHFNHHLREEADQDARAAGVMASHLDIPFISGGADVPELVREQKISVEEAARQSRYIWLLEQARLYAAQAVAVAHTADDQVETILMHLLRGCGLDGLTGMPYRQFFPLWDERIPVVRPLLTFWRSDTEAICTAAQLQPVVDVSNQSTRYFRNRIRLELVPYLQEYNPQVKAHLLQTAQILSEEKGILEPIIEKAWLDCQVERTGNRLTIDKHQLESLSESLRRLILRRALLELEPTLRDIDFLRTEMLSNLALHSTRSGEAHLFGNLWVQIGVNRIVFWKGKPGLTSNHPQVEMVQEISLPPSGRADFPGWRLETSEVNIQDVNLQTIENSTNETIWLDADRLVFPLLVRSAKPGERLAPLGMGGKTQKISDYFVNRKIPRQAREKWPLVLSGSEIVWVVGQGISETAAITSQTRRVVQLSLQFLSPRRDGST